MKTGRAVRIALAVGALAAPFSSWAQPQQRVYRIGILRSDTAASANQQVEVFTQALRELGYVERKNVLIERRFAEGILERLPALAADLVQQKVDLIVVNNTPPALAAKQATDTIPIVFTVVADPIGNGLAASFARPGGNITGTTNISIELTEKRLQLLKEAFPKVSRVAVVNSSQPNSSGFQFAEVQRAAKALNMDVLSIELLRQDDFERQFTSLRKWRADSMYPLDNPINFNLRNLLVEFAARYRLPVIFGSKPYAEAGGLMSYGADLTANYRRAAIYVDKILKGAKPADLPVEAPTKFEFVINLKTAKQIGLTIPPNVLVRADKVIK
jgi:putative ABC transport system substrate-binding protein